MTYMPNDKVLLLLLSDEYIILGALQKEIKNWSIDENKARRNTKRLIVTGRP